jgi:hypothetical protein
VARAIGGAASGDRRDPLPRHEQITGRPGARGARADVSPT